VSFDVQPDPGAAEVKITAVEAGSAVNISLGGPSRDLIATCTLFNTVLATIAIPDAEVSSTTPSTTVPPSGPAYSITDATIVRPDKGTAKMVFTVSLSEAAGTGTSVKYETADASAVDKVDYKKKKGSVSLPAGKTSKTVSVNVIGGTVGQDDKTFNVNLSTPKNAAIADGQGVGTIQDNHLPGISIADASIARPARGTETVTFNFSLTTLPDPGKVTFKNGSTSATLKVTVKANDVPGNRVLVVRLSAPVNAPIVDGVAAGTITG
jgi:hypothetical protein